MSLDGAKIICLNDSAADQAVPARGRTFKFGYYMDCDVILEHPEALGLQCTIDCDAFGRVTIENRCPEQAITINGKVLKKMRPLLHNTEICIFDKKFLWIFEKSSQMVGFQMEDAIEFTTPCKKMKKAEQPPNSEPPRRWRTQFPKRLTIHSFAYWIKAGESPQDVEVTTDENKPRNTSEKLIAIESEPVFNKRLSSSTSFASDLIDLKTPKARLGFAGPKTLLSCCNLSGTVITSYSPRETAVRSSAGTPTKSTDIPDVTVSLFQHFPSPLAKNYRPSMHLIDLTTPKKQISLAFSPKRTLLKSALKKNIPKGKDLRTKSISSSTQEIASTSMDSVYSIHSTDDESVIELSDEGSFSPSPVVRMSPRSRTPQSLMKRAILSSVKKTAITKRLQQKLPARPLTSITLKNPQQTSGVRIQCHSTPHHKSVERLRSPPSGRSVKDSHSVSGKAPKPIITSTPFRARQSTATLRSPSTSLTGVKNKSRTSFMLKQALSKSPQKGASQKRKSLSFLEASVSVPEQSCARKSVSFLDRIESEQTLNQTFTIEDQVDETEVKTNLSNEEKNSENERCDEESSKLIKDKKGDCSALASILISDEKMSFSNLVENRDKPHKHNTKTNILEETGIQSAKSNVTFSPPKTESMSVADMPAAGDDTEVPSVLLPTVNLSSKLGKNDGNGTVEQICLNLTFSSEGNVNSVAAHPEDEPTEHSTLKARHSTVENLDLSESPIQQTLQSLKSLKHNIVPTVNTIQPVSTEILHRDENIVEGEDFDGLDAIFKTPKARNLMILSSPKSISLQKPTTDSVELVHSTEFDLGASLEDIFRTPQSEFITNRGEADTTKAAEENVESFSPEEAFDMLVGRPINRRSYVRKNSPKQQQFLPLLNPKNAAFPKTDIEEWIADVNKSNELLDTDQYEDEMSYLTATRSEFSHDPLMSSSISGSVNTKAKRKQRVRSPTAESPMTIEVDDDEEENVEKEPVLKDPLEISSPKKSVSPNISGIDLLDHTSESLFSETLAVSDESSGKETEKTIGFAKNKQDDKVTCVETDIVMSTDKAHKQMEQAFENFEKGRRILDGKRLVSTPDPKKPLSKHTSRRTLGNQQTLDVFFNLKTLKTEREMEVAFENFTKQPKKITGERLARTPELVKPTEKKKMRKTMGNQTESEGVFDLDAAKTEREMQLAFENFEDIPKFLEERAIQTPQPKKRTREDHMRTMGSSMVPEFKLDLKAEKLKHEKKPSERLVQTSESKKSPLKVHGKTLGTSSPEVKLINNTNADHEMELVFENFEEEPTISKERLVQTPEPKKASQKDHQRTMGTSLVPDVKLDLKAAKAEREMELAFENFEEEPTISKERMVQTPEPKKSSLKDHRRTMGTSLVPDVKLDLKAAKAEREMELAFENFQEEPTIFKDRMVKTPEQKRSSLKDHRRTMGTSLVSEVKLDLKAARAEREMELVFENFEEEPTISKERMVQTPEPKKMSLKDHRRTMGTSLVPDVKLDLKAAKAKREMELAFENFEEDPTISKERKVQTPEQKRSSLKDHRRTMGTSLVSEVKLDLKAARAEREMELAFENFQDEPTISKERKVQTPEQKRSSLKDHRRTMGTSLVSEVKLDLKAAKAEREMELAFENFEEDPTISMERKVQTPEQKRSSLKDHRRTMGTSLVSEVKLDLKAARAEREMELVFENFEEEPTISKERMVQTPEPKKMSLKDHRRTMGTSLVPDVKLDLKAAKAKREMELAFENFEEDPTISKERKVQTPEQKRSSLKDHRRTMGTSLVSEVKLDLKAARAEREMELAFENFQDEPTISKERKVQTPEQKRSSLKDHRRTMGTSLVSEVKLDLKAARAQREMELAFENFEEEPIISKERMIQTPEPKKTSLKDHRRTMGTSLVPDVKLDLKAAKAEREMELAFENFEEDPTISKKRMIQTPEPKKSNKTSSLTSINCDTDDVLTSYKVKQLTENEKAAKCQRHVTDEEMLLQTMAEPKTVALSMIDKDVQPQQSSEGVQPEEITLAYTADTRAGKLLSETIDISIDKENKFKEGVEDGGHPSQTSEFYEKFIEESHEEQCRNIRKSQTPVDNAEKTENQSMQNVTAAPTTSQSRPRRGRQNTIDNAQQLNENKYDLDVKITQKRTRRQNSVDLKQMPQDKSIGHVTKPQEKVESVVSVADKCENSPKIGEQNQTIHEDSNINRKSMTQAVVNKMDERKSDQESNLNNEDFFIDTHVDRSEIYSVKEHNIVVKVDSTDVDSTEDESKRAPTTRKKRLRKVSALTAISSQTVSEIQHHLEPIEEERKIAATSTDREVIEDGGVELSSRPARRRGGRKDISAQKGVQQQETPKSVVSLKAEGDEIISSSPVSSNNRIRGRKAQLNVVLVESEPKSSSTAIGIEIMADTTEHFGISAGESETRSLHVKSEPAEDHLASEFQTSNTETFAAEEESTVLEGKINQLQSQRTNLEEVIPVTPAQVKRRGRKPGLKAGSIESATLPLRRGRRGSVQQDSDVQVNKVDVKVVPSATREPNTDEEITEIETVKVERIDVEEMIPCTPVLLKTRGRKKAVKTQSIESTTPVIVLRKGRRGSIQQDSDVKPLGEEEVVACTPVALLKTRSHRAGSKLEAAESTPASLTSYRKGGRRVTNTEEADIEEVVASTPLRSKPRGRRAAVKSDPTETMKENSTPVQPVGRKRAVVKAIERSTPEVVPEHDMGVQALDADVGRVSESTPVLSKKRGRRPLLKVEDTAEHSIPVGLKDQTATIEQNIGVHIVQVAVAPFNTRGRRVALEPQLNVAEDLSSNQMIGQKIAVGQDSETNTDDDNIEKLIPSKKRGRQATLKSKSSAEENVQINVKESDAGIEEVIQPKKRGRPAAVKIELIESVKNSTPTRKRGQKEVVQEPTQVKSTETLSLVSNKIQADAEETLSLSCQVASQTRRRQANLKRESAGENLTPVKKRGRNVMNNISAHEANDIKSEKEEEYTDSDPVKAEINNKPIRRRRASAKQPTSAKISEVVSKEEQISLTDDVLIDKSEKQVVRSRRVASPSPSHADPQAEKAHTAHIESPKKPVRGRRAAPKKNSTVESISTTEEEQSVSAVRAKTTRGRKPIVEVSTSPDNIEVKENNKNTATGRRRKGNITADAVKAIVSSDKEQTVSEQVNKKPTRGKRGVQPTSETAAENSSQIVEESQPSSVTKKLARERKAIKDTNDEQQYQSEEAPKKPTRSRKAQEPEKKEEKTAAVPKRTNRRIVEVAAEPDQDHTPSKRLRRKPHILLSDEYVH